MPGCEHGPVKRGYTPVSADMKTPVRWLGRWSGGLDGNVKAKGAQLLDQLLR